MQSISLKPKQSVNLLLENVSSLKNPKISITLDEGVLKRSPNKFDLLSDTDIQHNESSCNSCDKLRQMLYLRDRTIMKLAEDRDSIKIKLTKAMNMNIELSRQLIKYQNKTPVGNQLISTPPTTYNEKIREEVDDLRKKCAELEDINQHLKYHLHALKNVFTELGNEASYFELPSTSTEQSTIKSIETVDNGDDALNGTYVVTEQDDQLINNTQPASKISPVKHSKPVENTVLDQTNQHDPLSDFEIWYNN